ncbi:hypothetical protein Q1695_009032 [Nippostrongylus brasiliensis]|nr:hypothetical protein Q1695_009032 [Nippostrongylus brasiliensis]
MVGENLLDKTPPESERLTTSKETKDTGGTGQSGTTDEPEITAPPHTDPSERKSDEIHTQATVSVPRTPLKQEPITAPTPKTPASVP